VRTAIFCAHEIEIVALPQPLKFSLAVSQKGFISPMMHVCEFALSVAYPLNVARMINNVSLVIDDP
jgi:hypothetical protein